ncbi:hypothetical protein [Corynebacterium halotolerans]|uniref:hypothetical protein n=1 Tax=Corynebacterium halotolerans TaxID=225326 RepID=UPI003CEB389A
MTSPRWLTVTATALLLTVTAAGCTAPETEETINTTATSTIQTTATVLADTTVSSSAHPGTRLRGRSNLH